MGTLENSFFFKLCYVPYRMAFIWHSPRESTSLSGPENICQAKIRKIGPELRVLYNVL